MKTTTPVRSTAARKKTSKPVAAVKKPKTAAKTARATNATHPRGTQTIHRAVAMLREIAAFQKGMRLVDIASAMELERPTAHRIVKGLVSQGMVMQDPVTKCYRLGHVVYELGLAASPYFNLKEVCQPTLERIGQSTQDTVYLVVRSGFDTVCLALVEGSYPIRTRTMEVGTRRPLGVGAASVALMLSLSDDEVGRIIAVNSPRLQSFGRITGERLREVIAESRAAGFSINEENVLPGVGALGAAIHTRGGPPYAAISIAGIRERFEGPRREELARMLLKETRALARKLDDLSVSWA
ncbi:IclR family transcriptional regulator [Variovorax sp. M-6]|uniref:IclR family transcriptional regulator n=1 Tax=Variovorax sp. M-6 TaxID=3233041 RepID=UPI003F9A5537